MEFLLYLIFFFPHINKKKLTFQISEILRLAAEPPYLEEKIKLIKRSN